MGSSLYSPSWYRVAGLRPRLRSHLEIHRHHYRGELWYVLQDHATGRFQRFTPAAYQLIGLMDGQRTVQQIWDAGRARLAEDAPTQEEVVRILSQLHAIDALQTDVLPDAAELHGRFGRQRRARLLQQLSSPLFVRLPLFDPERLLRRLAPWVGFVFGWAGAGVWLTVVLYGLTQAGAHWPQLTGNLTDRILAPSNLVVLWLTYPFLKAFHEFAHAFAVKARGGEVHEMGIMLLVFNPIPYVDASAASAFRRRRDRMLVGAAGIAAELFVAALAVLVWANSQPGAVRAVAFNVIFIASVSTVLFNGNPLLRYDAYYILADLLEIPNLASRGSRYLTDLLLRALGAGEQEPPPATAGERFWFVLYTLLSFVYRIFIYVSIILFVASKLFFVGALVAAWGIVGLFVLPLGRAVRFLTRSPRLRQRRGWALGLSGLVLAVAVGLLVVLPLPLRTLVQGVVWIPERAFVRASTDGVVDSVLVAAGSRVEPGQPLVACSDPLLPAQIRLLEARLREEEAQYDAQIVGDRVRADITRQQIERTQAEAADARQRAADLTVRASSSGRLVLPEAADLPGRFVHRGQLLGYVLDSTATTARVVVTQDDIDLVRQRTRAVHLRLAEDPSRILPGRLLREVPAATDQLPSPTLARDGGGQIAVDPREQAGVKAFQRVFLFDVELPPSQPLRMVGARLHVRFDHGSEPVAFRWYRAVRQLFLKRFSA